MPVSQPPFSGSFHPPFQSPFFSYPPTLPQLFAATLLTGLTSLVLLKVTSFVYSFFTHQNTLLLQLNEEYCLEKKLLENDKRKMALCPTMPQRLTRPDGTVTILNTPPPLKGLVISGGGYKGAVLPYYFEVMENELHFMETIQTLYGTSTGSLFGYLLSVGVPMSKIKESLKKISLMNVWKKGGDDQQITLGKDSMYMALNWKGTHLTETVEELVKEEVLSFLENKQIPSQELKERHQNKFKNGITFEDLSLLHRLFPEKFTLLSLTAVKKGDSSLSNEIVRFDCKASNPHFQCPIKTALRASIALPGFFAPVKIDKEFYVDGGVMNNIPIAAALEDNLDLKEILAFAFDENGRVTKTLFGTPIQKKQVREPLWLVKKILGPQLADYRTNDLDQIEKLGSRVCILPFGNLGVLPNLLNQQSELNLAIAATKVASIKKCREMLGEVTIYESR